MNVLVTGGAGYIGSHTCVALIEAGFNPIILDNFYNSELSIVERIKKTSKVTVELIEADVKDSSKLDEALKTYKPVAIIHFAAYKAVGESVSDPLKYYDNNTSNLINLARVSKIPIIFSSTAAVYGTTDDDQSLDEKGPTRPDSPYGRSKLMSEMILEDKSKADNIPNVALRYFNVIGEHPSGFLSEKSKIAPQSLMPLVQLAAKNGTTLFVNGNDYPTPDGTNIRDYIDVCDLAEAHLSALKGILDNKINKFEIFNVGTGKGSSVLEVINTYNKVKNTQIKYEIRSRRPGDVVTSVANPQNIETALGWKAVRSLEDSIRSLRD